jgi:hypothetical protein
MRGAIGGTICVGNCEANVNRGDSDNCSSFQQATGGGFTTSNLSIAPVVRFNNMWHDTRQPLLPRWTTPAIIVLTAPPKNQTQK